MCILITNIQIKIHESVAALATLSRDLYLTLFPAKSHDRTVTVTNKCLTPSRSERLVFFRKC